MVKIVHLTTVHQRDDIRVFRKQCVSLSAAGHDVALIVADGKGDAVVNGIPVHDIGRPVNRLQRMGKSFAAGPLIRQLRPDFVHFHDPELMPLGIVLRALGYRVIYDVHEDVPATIKTKTWLPLGTRPLFASAAGFAEWISGRTLHRIVAATPHIAGKFPPGRTSLVQNFPLKDELVKLKIAESDVPCFVYVGGITRERGYYEMIEAARRFGRGKLLLAGRIMPGASIEVADAPNVEHLGQQSRSAVANLLSISRAGLVLFHPYENHVEAQPNKMFEYMSAGLPVIASNFPLWREIIEGAQCGICVDPKSPSDISGAMEWILDHPEEARTMGERGRVAVEQRYNWAKEEAALFEVYST